MTSDPFAKLASVIRRESARAASANVRFIRARVTSVAPLEVKTEDGRLHLSEDDEDVEVSGVVADAIDVGSLAEGDLMDVREEQDGYVLSGVIT